VSGAADEAAAHEEALTAALRWVSGLLEGCAIPFQVTGDAAASAHGATRRIGSIELFVAAEHVPALLRSAEAHVVDYPWRRMDEAWDRVALALSHDTVTIDVCVVEAARFKEAATGGWVDAAIDPQASVSMRVLGVDAPVMPREPLLDQKRQVDREVDRQDIRDITAARRAAGSGWPSADR
jgi:hypothetical protein